MRFLNGLGGRIGSLSRGYRVPVQQHRLNRIVSRLGFRL